MFCAFKHLFFVDFLYISDGCQPLHDSWPSLDAGVKYAKILDTAKRYNQNIFTCPKHFMLVALACCTKQACKHKKMHKIETKLAPVLQK